MIMDCLEDSFYFSNTLLFIEVVYEFVIVSVYCFASVVVLSS